MINMKNKSLIIFDWDGTLMDSVGLIVDAMRYAAKKHGLTVTDEATKSIIGIALVDAFPMLFPNDSEYCQTLELKRFFFFFKLLTKPQASPIRSCCKQF